MNISYLPVVKWHSTISGIASNALVTASKEAGLFAKKLPTSHHIKSAGNTAKCIDVAILAEGYTPEEMPVFYEDAAIACESLFAHEPLNS